MNKNEILPSSRRKLMLVMKLYRKPDKPEFYSLIRWNGGRLLVNYPIDVPNHKRQARWFEYHEVYIDWIREFSE